MAMQIASQLPDDDADEASGAALDSTAAGAGEAALLNRAEFVRICERLF